MTKTLSCRMLLLSLVALVGQAALASAATYYADPTGVSACACNDASAWCTDPPSTSPCGSIDQPYRCLSDAVKRACSGDTVIAKNGTYQDCVYVHNFKDHIEIRAEADGQATIERQSSCATSDGGVWIAGSFVTLRGFKITKAATAPVSSGLLLEGGNNLVTQCEIYGDQTGVFIQSSNNTMTDVIVRNNWAGGVEVGAGANNNTISGGQIMDGSVGINVWNASPQPSGNTFTGVDIHGLLGGVTLGGGENTTIDKCHLHHNWANGVLEGYPATNTRIQYSEFDNNIVGLYLKGKRSDSPAPLGTIHGNSVHHNAGWGIHLWAGTQGTPTQHYVVDGNDVYANGAGIVVGGDYSISDPGGPCRTVPQYTEVRYNLVHHNSDTGIWYGQSACAPTISCTGTDVGNSFHHNTLYANGGVQFVASFAKDNRVSWRNNIVMGNSTVPTLVQVSDSNLAANFLDGNTYFRPGSGSGDTALFSWNSLNYSFDQVNSTGVKQDAGGACEAAVAGDPYTHMETNHSVWGSQISMVDASPKSWATPYKSLCPPGGGLCFHDRQGDYHLAVGSSGTIPGGTGGVCCAGSNGGKDIDDEAAPACTPDCSSIGDGVGADFYPDFDSDGIADLFDCPSSGICDGDPFDPNPEVACSANPAAEYDPSTYPGAPNEVCDGKDNDCLGGSETDADLDGYFPGCPGTADYDCNDADPKIHRGAIETASVLATCFDGVDNDCDGVTDLDCSTNLFPGGQLIVMGTPTPTPPNPLCGTVDNMTATSDNNTYQCLQETGSPFKVNVVWTLSSTGVQTGVNHDLRVEGFRNSGANDTFNFSSSKKTAGPNGTCGASDGGTSTILTISDTSDTNQLKTADLGLSSSAYCVKVVGSKETGDSNRDTLTLDRLFVFPSPVAVKDYSFDPPETGTVLLGDHRATQISDDPFIQIIREELSGGTYRLSHTWQFNNVPAGSGHKLHFEGHRLPVSGIPTDPKDDFKFYWSTNPSSGYAAITGSTINTTSDPSGGLNSSSFGTGSLSGTVYIRVMDAQVSGKGNAQTIVYVDHLAITTVP